jgi:hypothetical protein
MTFEDECKQLMQCKEKIKEYKKREEQIKNSIMSYLKNHNQDGVIFKYNNKNVTIMVESIHVKKNVSKKEREKKVQNILVNAGVKDIDSTTQEIINGLRQASVTDKSTKSRLKTIQKNN